MHAARCQGHLGEMRGRQESEWGFAGGGIAALEIAAFAIVCCAALPLLIAFAGSLAIGSALGIGMGLVVLIALASAIILCYRRRVRCDAPGSTVGSD